MDAVKHVNAKVRELAPVLNSPTLTDAATVTSSDPAVPVALLCKRHGGATFVFAVSTRNAPTMASFAVAGLTGNANVEVIAEDRSLDAPGGKFSDRFDGYGVHLYRVK
jgi:hypothetical protein